MEMKNLILAFSIIILTIFVTFYGINTMFPSQEYEDFCDNLNFKVFDTKVECDAVGGMWNSDVGVKSPEVSLEGWCDIDSSCREELENARQVRSKYVFFVALPLGILLIILGAFLFKIDVVGTGLIGGGVGTLIYGGGAFWPYTENWIRFVLSLIGLVILIWLIYYFSNRK